MVKMVKMIERIKVSKDQILMLMMISHYGNWHTTLKPSLESEIFHKKLSFVPDKFHYAHLNGKTGKYGVFL